MVRVFDLSKNTSMSGLVQLISISLQIYTLYEFQAQTMQVENQVISDSFQAVSQNTTVEVEPPTTIIAEVVETKRFNSRQQLPELFTCAFMGGICRLQKRAYGVKIQLHFEPLQHKNYNSFEQLLNKRNLEAQEIEFNLTDQYMSGELKQSFRSAANVHLFLANYLGSDKVVVQREKMSLVVGEGKVVQINLMEQVYIDRQLNKISFDFSNIEDKLLLFRNHELDMLNQVWETLSDPQRNQIYDEEQLDEIYGRCYGMTAEEEQRLNQFLNEQTNKIESFQKTFAEQLRFVNINTPSLPSIAAIKPTYPLQKSPARTLTPNQPNQPFPPGYTPPHLVNPVTPGGFAPEEHLRLHANQTKKEKLRMSKQMLKMGYSVDEIIQRLEEIERIQKSGKIQNKNLYVAPSQGPVRAFHLPKQQPNPVNYNPQRQPPPQRPNNQRLVRDRLIALLREKRYKKLDDIQRHIAAEGIQTTVQVLKGMIDEIRAKNAQKRAQNHQP